MNEEIEIMMKNIGNYLKALLRGYEEELDDHDYLLAHNIIGTIWGLLINMAEFDYDIIIDSIENPYPEIRGVVVRGKLYEGLRRPKKNEP